MAYSYQNNTPGLAFTVAGHRLIATELRITLADSARIDFSDPIALLETLVLDAGYPDGCCWVTERGETMDPAQRAWLYVNDEECARIEPPIRVDAQLLLAQIIVGCAVRH
ncbi:hypothetical protein AURDEDRAFT_168894 [Auricularia subglabra TFB-10046 SS5]|nr:hypothetical protein AURDEDRAFT_168894 [Auricularia subglabra TFB-10046 SS5]